ncbi:MAG: hypothetical protein ACREUT_20895 [Steroidobacteraceae bacterium]
MDEAYAARHRDVRAGGYALIAVSDTGSGTSEPAKLLEPLLSTMNLERLAQVDAFAKDSGGHVTVEGDVRRGTTVKVYLPWVTEARACNPRR